MKNLLNIVNTDISLVYFVFDGAFGNNDALQMVRQCELHLISKMLSRFKFFFKKLKPRNDSALYFSYTGKYSGHGRRKW
jgi:putative transposase